MSTSPTTTPDNYYSTPGQILDEEFLQPLNISRYRLAKTIGVSETAIGEIIHGKRRISTAMAWRLSKAFGTTAEFWSNLQTDYDLLTFDPASLGDIQPLVTT
ncbi:HigA family addiction module antitoxin [Bifidobacterium jacchi]|uniref:Addiction module antidote protein, HigA family n=1 Tax=Bifidobacterium jacchi TaxID=2490545 RepID=A0A5N5RJR3_9BIFI|nr:HigA family addiction module antitoxin [Bifidobacterium jacchi]KAB5607566.1 addiction module antidote protein, HigA family [Bifidobacterium jacchi]